MPVRSILLTPGCVALIAIGQLLFKSAAAQWRVDGIPWAALRGFLSRLMPVAPVVYAFATLPRVYVLRAVPLSTAYAMFALAFVMVPSLAHVALYEPLSINAIVGGAIIVLGTVGAVH